MTSRLSEPSVNNPSLSGDGNSYNSPRVVRDRASHLQQPPTAYYKQSRHFPLRASPVVYVPSPRQHGSISSDGTLSSTASICKINHPTYSSPYCIAPYAEQGHTSPPKSGHLNVPVHTVTPQSMSDSGKRTRDDNSTVFRYIQEREAQERADDHAISVLAFLSTLDPLYSAITAFYSVFIGLVFLLVSPLCICNKSFAPGNSTIRLIAPLLRKHLQLLHHSDSLEDLHTFNFSPILLVLIHAISPLLSIGIAISAWVAACFWLFALMMGNPDGTERGDDGKATVLNLRDWWADFLLSSAKRARC